MAILILAKLLLHLPPQIWIRVALVVSMSIGKYQPGIVPRPTCNYTSNIIKKRELHGIQNLNWPFFFFFNFSISFLHFFSPQPISSPPLLHDLCKVWPKTIPNLIKAGCASRSPQGLIPARSSHLGCSFQKQARIFPTVH